MNEQAGDEIEIEITPEMLKEGMLVFSNYSRRFDSGYELVVDIYRAMAQVDPLRFHRDHDGMPP